jgi:hypothetical protein
MISIYLRHFPNNYHQIKNLMNHLQLCELNNYHQIKNLMNHLQLCELNYYMSP